MTNETPKVTVLMSVYNGERFLQPAIESVLNQTFENFEFLIINDGSSDSSKKIIESYKDPRIRLIDQPNHGFIYSLNKGVEIARGDYIARMDQDDISLPSRLKKQIKLLESSPKIGAVSTFFELINFEDGSPIGTTLVFPSEVLDLKRALYIHNPMAHGSTTFRKKAWLDAGKYRQEYHPPEDYDLWRRIAKTWDLGMVPEVLFQYRINNPESMSKKNNTITEKNVIRIQQELREEPFIYKGLWATIKGYNNINAQKYGVYSDTVRNEYNNLQYSLARVFLESIAPKKALVPMLYILIMKPRYSPELLRKYPWSLNLYIKRRLRK